MTLTGPARQRRCRALVVAIGLGLVLVVVGALDRGWVSVVAGVVGSAVALVLYRRECGDRPSGES
jgi:hypothetical protein